MSIPQPPQPPNDGNPDAWRQYLAFWLDARANMPDAIERVALNVANHIRVRNVRIKLREDALKLKLERISQLENHLFSMRKEAEKLRLSIRQTAAMFQGLVRTIAQREQHLIWSHPNAFASDSKDDGGGDTLAVREGVPAGSPPDGSSPSRDALERAVDRQDSAPGEERPGPSADAAEFRGDQETRGE